MRVARTLGLAEALDLEPAEAVKLTEQLAKSDEKRIAIHKQLADAKQTLRRAASGEKVTAAEVDQAIQRMFDGARAARGDRSRRGPVAREGPHARRRALGRCCSSSGSTPRFGQGPACTAAPGAGWRGRGDGMGMGGGMGRAGPGAWAWAGDGPGMMAGACPNPDCPMEWAGRDEDD